jgi:hypothetical protein
MAVLLTNFSLSGNYISPAFTLTFDITSDSDNVTKSSISVHFSETVFTDPVISSGIPQDGYNVNIIETVVDDNLGYNISIIPSSLHKSMTIAVKIDASDGEGATSFTRYFSTATHIGTIAYIDPGLGTTIQQSSEFSGFTFSGKNNNILFQLNDANEPIITNRIPVVNSTTAPPNTNIQFSLHDSGQEGVDITSLYVYINDEQVIDGSAFVFPYTGTITSDIIDGFDGWTVVIDPNSNFLYEQWVSVRVIVSDMVDDPSSVNTLDTTYQFRTVERPDITGPSVDPTQPSTGLSLDSCIEFNWLDEPQGLGPDWDTLGVTLRRETTIDCITSIRDDIAIISGVAQLGYTVYSSSIVVGEQVGYHVTLCPEIPFNELETITVIITGDDLGGSQSTNTFNISTVEITPPTILNLNPASLSTNVSSQSPVYFEMHDSAGSGVDVDRVSVNIDDGEAVINGIAQPGYNLSIVNDRIIDEFGLDFDGYEFTITRDIPFSPGKNIAVAIDGYDAYGNHAIPSVYCFTVEEDTTAPDIIVLPENGSTGMPRNQNFTVDIIDLLGVDQDSVNITIQDISAIINGVVVPPFDVYKSEIITIPGIVDGYRYIIDTENDFGFNEKVTINIEAKDIYGNQASSSSYIITFNDTTGPSITNISPRNNQLEVSLNPTMSFTIRDGYDIAFELTSVTVNGESAILNGLAQSGYSLTTSRISGGILGVEPGDGYNIYLTKTENFDYNQNIIVEINVYDRSQNNKTSEIVSYNTINPLPPVFDSLIKENDTDVPLDTNWIFEIFGDGYGVDINTLQFSVSGAAMITDGYIVPPASGTIQTIIDGQHYRVIVDPKYLLSSASLHSFYLSAAEPISGNLGVLAFSFFTEDPLENPETLYIGSSNGVLSLLAGDVTYNSEPAQLFDGYYVHDLSGTILNEINKLAVATRDSGAFVYSTNYNWPTIFYSVGDEITKIHINNNNNGTIYLANRTRQRVDVYYNILTDDSDRYIPDVYYDSVDGYAVPGILDGYFTDMVVTENTSRVNASSSSIYLGTSSGVFKIDTDESVPGITEINGTTTSYGIIGSGYDYDILEGDTNNIIAIDINTRLNHLYIASRGITVDKQNTLTYIDLSTNTRDGSVTEPMLIHRIINNINFKD